MGQSIGPVQNQCPVELGPAYMKSLAAILVITYTLVILVFQYFHMH